MVSSADEVLIKTEASKDGKEETLEADVPSPAYAPLSTSYLSANPSVRHVHSLTARSLHHSR